MLSFHRDLVYMHARAITIYFLYFRIYEKYCFKDSFTNVSNTLLQTNRVVTLDECIHFKNKSRCTIFTKNYYYKSNSLIIKYYILNGEESECIL